MDDIDKVELHLPPTDRHCASGPTAFLWQCKRQHSLTDPSASAEEIANSAQIACAHEFIMGLSSGYSTKLGERGASLLVVSVNGWR